MTGVETIQTESLGAVGVLNEELSVDDRASVALAVAGNWTSFL